MLANLIVNKYSHLFLIAAVSALIYGKSLWGGLVWDDHYYATIFPIRFNSAESLFLPTDLAGAIMVFYRPMVGLSYLLDYAFWDDNFAGFHATNILLHSLTACSFLLIARRVLADASRALMAALLFALHPIHTESVCWISGRTDLIAAFFSLLALYCHIEYRNRHDKAALFAACLFFAFGLFAKEIAFAMPLLALAYDILIAKHRRVHLSAFAGYLLVFAIYAILRQMYLSQAPVQISLKPFADIPLILFSSIGFYSYKIILPFNLNLFIAEIHPSFVFSAFGACVLALFFIFAKKQNAWSAFCLFGFIVTLAPSVFGSCTTNLNPPFAERYLYLPSVFFCLALARMGFPAKRIWRFICVTVMVLFVFMTLHRVAVWRDELPIWQDTVKKTAHWYPANELGRTMITRIGADAALTTLQQAFTSAEIMRARPASKARILNNIGQAHMMNRDIPHALSAYQTALTHDPSNVTANHNTAAIFAYLSTIEPDNKREHLKKALIHYSNALREDPYFFESYVGYAETCFYFGDIDRALSYYRFILYRAPNTKYSGEAIKSILARKLWDRL